MATDAFDPYKALNVPRDADEKKIRSAYREALKSVHPDRDAYQDDAGKRLNAARREDILRAQNTLLNPRQRSAYDSPPPTSPQRAPTAATPLRALSPSTIESQQSASQSYAQSLAAARARGMIIRHITPAAKAELTEPSRTRFSLAQVLAVSGDLFDGFEDIADIVAAFLGFGVGGVAAWIIGIIIEILLFDIPLMLLIGGSVRNNAAILEQANEEIEMHHRRMISYRTRYAAVLKTARNIPGMRRPVNKIALRFADIRNNVRKGIWGRTWKRFGFDLIPFVDLWPTKWLTVRKQKKLAWEVYELAKEALEERKLAQEEADDMEEEMQRQLAA